MERIDGIARRGIHGSDIGVDHAADERVVEASLLGSGVVREIGEVERAEKLLGAGEKGRDVFGEKEVGGEEHGEKTGVADMGIETRKDANRTENGVRIGGHVFEMERVRRVEGVQIERLKVVLEERLFLQSAIL